MSAKKKRKKMPLRSEKKYKISKLKSSVVLMQPIRRLRREWGGDETPRGGSEILPFSKEDEPGDAGKRTETIRGV